MLATEKHADQIYDCSTILELSPEAELVFSSDGIRAISRCAVDLAADCERMAELLRRAESVIEELSDTNNDYGDGFVLFCDIRRALGEE